MTAQPPAHVILMQKDKKPIFKQKITDKKLKNFMQKFEAWATGSALTDANKKSNLSTAFENAGAEQYFSIYQKQISDATITWDTFKKSFIKNCPRDQEEKDIKMVDISSHEQEPTEFALSFVTRIRYLFGDNWDLYKEDELCEAIIRQMLPGIRRFIQIRGLPATYEELIKIIEEYEGKGMKELDNFLSPKKTEDKPETNNTERLIQAIKNLNIQMVQPQTQDNWGIDEPTIPQQKKRPPLSRQPSHV
jgi:hypothetical protein